MKNRIIAFACIAALALSACAGEDEVDNSDVTVYVVDHAYLDQAKDAASQWRACGSRQVFVRASDDTGVAVLWVVPATDPDLQGSKGVTRRTHPELHTAWIKVDSGSQNMTSMIAHEMGHALLSLPYGSEHFGVGIMQATVPDDARVTPADCQALRDRWRGVRND